MKARLLALLVLPTLLLSSCRGLLDLKTTEKEISVYDIDKLNEEKSLSSGYQSTIKARFISGKELIPYLTLKQYASLYESHFAEGFVSAVDNQSFSSLFYHTVWKNIFPPLRRYSLR